MDRVTLLERLDRAEWHVAIGETIIAEERARLERVREAGSDIDSVAEESTLALLQEIQSLHLAARDQLLDEIRDRADIPLKPGGSHH